MALLTSTWTLDAAALLLSFIIILYFYMGKNFGYWKKKGIPYEKPQPFIGTFKDLVLLRCTIGEYFSKVYLKHDGLPYVGIYGLNQPILVVRDRDLIKQILIKDFHFFIDRMFTPDENSDPVTNKVLFGSKGEVWKHTRSHLTQTFTSGKMKRMFPLVEFCGKEMVNMLEVSAKTGKAVDIKGILARFTTDVIATCVFGLEANCIKDEGVEFWQKTKMLFTFTFFKHLSSVLIFFAPRLASLLRLQLFEQEIIDFIWKVTMKNVNRRIQNKEIRKDFLDLLIQLKLEGKVVDDDPSNGKIIAKEKDEHLVTPSSGNKFYFEDIDIVAQALQFLAAGYETSSSTMTFGLYLLAMNLDVQKKLHRELKTALSKNNGGLTYDCLMEHKYLDMVLREILRLYPVLAFLDRRADKNYKIPDTDIILNKGTPIVIPIMGMHRDPKYFPDPLKFDPERFSEENIQKIPNFAYLPFGDGPRHCIGKRMAYLQVKVGLGYILSNFQVEPANDTPKNLILEPMGFLLSPRGKLPLNFKKL